MDSNRLWRLLRILTANKREAQYVGDEHSLGSAKVALDVQ